MDIGEVGEGGILSWWYHSASLRSCASQNQLRYWQLSAKKPPQKECEKSCKRKWLNSAEQKAASSKQKAGKGGGRREVMLLSQPALVGLQTDQATDGEWREEILSTTWQQLTWRGRLVNEGSNSHSQQGSFFKGDVTWFADQKKLLQAWQVRAGGGEILLAVDCTGTGLGNPTAAAVSCKSDGYLAFCLTGGLHMFSGSRLSA